MYCGSTPVDNAKLANRQQGVPANPFLHHKENVVGRLDYLLDEQRDEQFRQGVQSDLDMLVLETMHANARRERRLRGGGRRRHATSGWRNRGFMFWFVLAILVYWFFLRPLGL